MAARYRTIRYEGAFYEDMREFVPDARQLDEMLVGTETVLAAAPETGRFIGGPVPVWAIDCAIPGSRRSVAIYYTFDEDTVTVERALLRALRR